MPEQRRVRGLALIMRRISIAVSLVAVVLMFAGFVDLLAINGVATLPGAAALLPGELLHMGSQPWGVWAMSAGILLLALLPILRIVLTIILFVRARNLLDAALGLVILVELFISMLTKG